MTLEVVSQVVLVLLPGSWHQLATIRITDEQWVLVESHLAELPRREGGRGRPWRSDRECLDGILWILKTGAQWKALPKEYPGYATCWRRLRMSEEHDVWKDIWSAVLGALDEKDLLDSEETFLDATFVAAKERATQSASPRGERDRSSLFWSSARVFLSEFSSPLRTNAKRRSRSRRSKK